MLKPDLFIFDITPDIKAKLRPKIALALSKSLKELPPRTLVKGQPSLTVSEAKERLEIEFPNFPPALDQVTFAQDFNLDYDPKEAGKILHQWLEEAVLYFRRQGSGLAMEMAGKTAKLSRPHLWQDLFDNTIHSLANSSGLLRSDQGVRLLDFLVECLKLWIKILADFLATMEPSSFNPNQVFFDVESDLEGQIKCDGLNINLKGRPDAVFIDPVGRIILWEYKFGRQINFETQIAQTILYMDLLEAISGSTWQEGRLAVFKPGDDQLAPIELIDEKSNEPQVLTFPPEVEGAFEGFIGNEPALRQLKIQLSLALRRKDVAMPVNILLCGPGGLGKTEIANRAAACLGLPLVSLNAKSFNSLDKIISQIDKALKSKRLEPVEDGIDSGAKKYVYPPLVLFLDEVHLLGKKADEFLNLFEPKERRGVLPDKVVDFSQVAILAATTDKGKLPAPFLTRFNIIDLLPYSVNEIAAMVSLYFSRKDVDIPPRVAEGMAWAGRLNPREALNKAVRFYESHQFDNQVYPLNLVGLERIRKDWKIDASGLGPNDLEYLKHLIEGPRGLSFLARALPVGKEEIESVIEPFLVQLGAIRPGSRGRELSEKGRKILLDLEK
ncbi:MAG: Holliday junction DNA helicase RuvB C-terminal domain-containing protein [Pseudomonadota bacterium]